MPTDAPGDGLGVGEAPGEGEGEGVAVGEGEIPGLGLGIGVADGPVPLLPDRQATALTATIQTRATRLQRL